MLPARERRTVRFRKWKPVRRDYGISYEYVNPIDGRTVRTGSDRWMRAKSRIASSALATGVDRFTVDGGLGVNRWVRDVIVSQEDAEEFFRSAVEDGFFELKGMYRRALAARARRLERETEVLP